MGMITVGGLILNLPSALRKPPAPERCGELCVHDGGAFGEICHGKGSEEIAAQNCGQESEISGAPIVNATDSAWQQPAAQAGHTRQTLDGPRHAGKRRTDVGVEGIHTQSRCHCALPQAIG
jgi:hypothetical protein